MADFHLVGPTADGDRADSDTVNCRATLRVTNPQLINRGNRRAGGEGCSARQDLTIRIGPGINVTRRAARSSSRQVRTSLRCISRIDHLMRPGIRDQPCRLRHHPGADSCAAVPIRYRHPVSSSPKSGNRGSCGAIAPLVGISSASTCSLRRQASIPHSKARNVLHVDLNPQHRRLRQNNARGRCIAACIRYCDHVHARRESGHLRSSRAMAPTVSHIPAATRRFRDNLPITTTISAEVTTS